MLVFKTVLMNRLHRFACALARLRDDTAAATAVEYGLLLAGVAVFILVTVFNIGSELENLFNAVQTKLSNSYS